MIKMLFLLTILACGTVPANELPKLLQAFEDYSGSQIVFQRDKLPRGGYYKIMVPLSSEKKIEACQILLEEAKKYPSQYLGKIGLKKVGVFAACVSPRGDGFRPFNQKYSGYLYYGVWNRRDAVVAAYYTKTQLPLTFHHEVFHHVDGTYQGTTNYQMYFRKDDPRYEKIIQGKNLYGKPFLSSSDRKSLKKKSQGKVLRYWVSDYASKNLGEDQAETARYFMVNRADGLLQAIFYPKLPGSQRIIHILKAYQFAVAKGPDFQWFANQVLGKTSFAEEKGFSVNKASSRTESRARRASVIDNPYIKQVDEKISNPLVRKKIRQVQIACVDVDRGSGINISSQGIILTAGHVAKKIGREVDVKFPNGSSFRATCTHINNHLDLAVLALKNTGDKTFPYASLARRAPSVGTRVVCIGQPGKTYKSKPTGYPSFCVSRGKIRGFLSDPLGKQSLGRTKHDAWTFWGHSGSPLFNHQGEIVAMHNSWDSNTAMRHAVTYEAIVHFLKTNKIDFRLARY